MFVFDPMYLLFLAPAMLLAMWAQYRLQATYSQASQVPVGMTGAAAARQVLDSAGLTNVDIEMVPGHLSDHYDPRNKVLRLSQAVYQGRSAASVGIAAHEAGHALQDAQNYAPLVIRNAAVSTANLGSGLGIWLVVLGAMFSQPLLLIGIGLYSVFVFFQLINLPVEFNASSRAKEQLAMLSIVDQEQGYYVKKVLGAAALTYVAATLSAVMTLLYFLMRFAGSRD